MTAHATTMNGFPHAQSGGADSNRSSHRHSLDATPHAPRMQAERNSALPMPVAAPHRTFQGMPSETSSFGPGGVPRSPPKNKNTQHVPCKFYLQGACQAGRMCPFSHDLEATTRPAPCKYFAKGGCKFGRKCALLHITPDGTVVNRLPPPSFQNLPPRQAFPGAALSPAGYPPSPGLLSMQAQGLESRPNGDVATDFDNYHHAARNGYDPVDLNFISASPTYGSPPRNDRLGASPPPVGLSVLDAPLPNSFDSNGISMAARNGPFAASMPSRFSIESPPSSLPRKSQLGNTALRDLHSSAFGDRGMDGMLANSMGSSPPSGADEPLTFPKRPLHSERLRAPRTIVSASLGTKLPSESFEYSDDGEDDTDREEELIPASLRDLIPEGRSRREARTRAEDDSPAAFLAAQRRTLSVRGTPQDSKISSPYSSSPGRFNGIAPRAQPPPSNPDGLPSSLRRISGLSPPPAARASNGDTAANAPKQAGMSMLTQGLQRTQIDAPPSQPTAPPASASAAPMRTLSNGSASRSSVDRGPGSTSVGKIDEEQELFDMDGVGEPLKRAAAALPRKGA